MMPHRISGVGAELASTCAPETGAVPWVLVDATADTASVPVLAEGVRPREYSRLGRTRLCSNRAIESQIAETVKACTRLQEPQKRILWMPNGLRRCCVTAPVPGPDNTVHAVQVWAGPTGLEPPPRPTVATLTWDPSTGVAHTTGVLEHLLDSTYREGGVRTMPDVMGHLARCDDRLGLLALFGDHAEALAWSGVAETAGAATGTRRYIRIAARRCGQGTEAVIRAVAHDISAGRPVAEPTLPEVLLRRMPVTEHHAIAVMDLRTNLLHEWIIPGCGALARWVYERPHLHPDDRLVIADARHQMNAGTRRCHNHFRIRFDCDSPWLHIDATWTGLSVGSSPQVMLDVTTPAPAPAVASAPSHAFSIRQGESR